MRHILHRVQCVQCVLCSMCSMFYVLCSMLLSQLAFRAVKNAQNDIRRQVLMVLGASDDAASQEFEHSLAAYLTRTADSFDCSKSCEVCASVCECARVGSSVRWMFVTIHSRNHLLPPAGSVQPIVVDIVRLSDTERVRGSSNVHQRLCSAGVVHERAATTAGHRVRAASVPQRHARPLPFIEPRLDADQDVLVARAARRHSRRRLCSSRSGHHVSRSKQVVPLALRLQVPTVGDATTRLCHKDEVVSQQRGCVVRDSSLAAIHRSIESDTARRSLILGCI